MRGAEIKTDTFTLIVDVAEYDEEGEPQGFLEIHTNNSNIQYISLDIPYRVAAGIIKFASGSTDLEGAIHVQKNKN
jgi:hypothetical protein